MRIIDSLDEMVETARGWLAGGTVGIMSLSSKLHEGHTALIQRMRDVSEISVVCVINKAILFGDAQDTHVQAGDLSKDLRLLSSLNVDIAFIPRAEEMYPTGIFSTHVIPTGSVAECLHGISNPSEIQMFTTTMTKILLLVRPDIAFFGHKDALRIAIIRGLVRDLHIDVHLQVLPTVREQDGLAISSRHQQLSSGERRLAPVIYQTLSEVKTLIEAGERRAESIEAYITDHIQAHAYLSLAYSRICDATTLSRRSDIVPGTLIALGVNIGAIQLSDNIEWMANGQWSA